MSFFNNIRVSIKLPVIMVALSLLALVVTTAISYVDARNSLADQAAIALEHRAVTQADMVADYLHSIELSLGIQVANPFVHEALDRFREGWDQVPGDADALLRQAYIDRNPNPKQDRALLDGANDGSLYSRHHRNYHAYFRATRDAHQLADVYLIDARGHVVYSVSKLADFAQFSDGIPDGSGLARAIAAAPEEPQNQHVSFVDFSAQSDLEQIHSAYFANSVSDKNGRFLGHVVYRITTAPFANLLSADRAEQAETLSRADGTVIVSSTSVSSIPVELVNIGRETGTGVREQQGTQGHTAFIGFAEITTLGTQWTLLAEVNRAAQLAAANSLLWTIVWNTAFVLGAICALGVLFGRSMSGPLVALERAIRDIANRNQSVDVPCLGRGDEVGAIALSVDHLKHDLQQAAGLEAENHFKSAALDSSSAALMIVDANFMITYVNPSASALMLDHIEAFQTVIPDFDPEHLVGSSVHQFHRADSQAKDKMLSMSEDQINADIKMGHSRFALLVAAVLGEEEHKLGYIAEWQDVTKIRTQDAIVDAIEANQCAFEMDPDGYLRSINENMQEALGLESLKEKRIEFKALWPADGGPQSEQIWTKITSGNKFVGKIELRHSGGNRVFLQAAMSPILDGSGIPQGYICIASNITQAEQDLQRSALENARASEIQSAVVLHLTQGLDRLSKGDLTTNIALEFEPEYDQLRLDFNATISKLNEVISGVAQNAQSIKEETLDIGASAEDLSKRTEHQAATLEEASAALSELTDSVQDSAKGAEDASSVVNEAKENAVASSSVVEEAVSAMGQIEKSSHQISKIVGLIDDIAFQTNLLALNAGVEAARAGDAGLGFAVVASEVRALALKSSNAAKEIEDLISTSGGYVKRGVELVDNTGTALQGILESVSGISNIVSGIAMSAQQQAGTLGEINSSITQLDQVTQQNAAMFEETTAASHSLSSEAENLHRIISHFEIGKPLVEKKHADAQSKEKMNASSQPADEYPVQLSAARNMAGQDLIGNDWSEF